MPMSDLRALAFAIAVPAVLVLLVWRWARGPRTRLGLRAEPDRPRAFGYKSTWLAVRSGDPARVVEALRAVDPRFRDATPCNWEHGMRRVFGAPLSPDVFVTPSIDGWVLVPGYKPDGHAAFSRRGGPKAALGALERIAAELEGSLWFFGTHRTVGYVDWVVIEHGRVRRAYAYVDGKTIYEVGEPTPEERALDLVFHDVPSDEHERSPSEATVIALASKWSIDPLELQRIEELSVGTLVRLG